ncbi:NAD(P)-binding protein [Hypoxylon sp. FL1857]|nr:NAD(P)-binding protein [Hypoxylon sp. FL1857]
MGAQWSQLFPPEPSLTESNLEPQDDKVFLVTGGYSGIGLELTKMLYEAHGRVYVAGCSPDKAQQAIRDIRAANPSSRGTLDFVYLQLNDLNSVREAAQEFKAKESKLNVLRNNAGVSWPPLGSMSKQGTELQLATNCIGPFLFTQLLLPLLEKTVADSPTASPPPGGLNMAEVRTPPRHRGQNYINSKIGNCLLASELARRVGPSQGIVSIVQNPGGAVTDLFRNVLWMKYLAWPLLNPPRKTAYTELYAGLSKDITMQKNGCYIYPWGRIAQDKELNKDLVVSMKSEQEGGNGKARGSWEFCEDKTRDYY